MWCLKAFPSCLLMGNKALLLATILLANLPEFFFFFCYVSQGDTTAFILPSITCTTEAKPFAKCLLFLFLGQQRLIKIFLKKEKKERKKQLLVYELWFPASLEGDEKTVHSVAPWKQIIFWLTCKAHSWINNPLLNHCKLIFIAGTFYKMNSVTRPGRHSPSPTSSCKCSLGRVSVLALNCHFPSAGFMRREQQKQQLPLKFLKQMLGHIMVVCTQQ